MVEFNLSMVNLLIQFVLFGMVVYMYYLARSKKYKVHGQWTIAATALHTISILVVMIPVFLGAYRLALGNLSQLDSALFIAHGTLGILGEILMVWLVLRFALKNFKVGADKCGGKTLMWATTAVMVASFLMGVAIYSLYYL